MPKPQLLYALIATDLSHLTPLVARAARNVPDLHSLLDQALADGARVITIRLVHPIPEPKGDS